MNSTLTFDCTSYKYHVKWCLHMYHKRLTLRLLSSINPLTNSIFDMYEVCA